MGTQLAKSPPTYVANLTGFENLSGLVAVFLEYKAALCAVQKEHKFMGAMTLLVDHRDSKLQITRAQVVCLTYPNGKQHRVGLYALRRIVVHGDIDLPSALLRECENAGVSVILLPGRRKGNSVNLFPHVESHFKLRQAQYRAYFDEKIRLSIAQKFVAAKITEQSSWLNYHNLNNDLLVLTEHVYQASDQTVLMGIEGGASKEYFAKWRNLWDENWRFNDRNRRPPRDPVNALLSLGYTLACSSVGHLASSYGLDLSLGFLHVPYRARPSLALDLLEPVRPWIDQWLWQQARDRILAQSQFCYNKETGCRLEKEGRSAFYSAWYDNAEPWLETRIRSSLALLLVMLRQYTHK